MPKRFTYKVYNAAGTFITNWDKEVLNEPTFTQEVNAAGIELVLKLGRSVLSYGEEADVKFNNIVKIYVQDNEYTTPTLFFQGYIANYKPVFEKPEYIEIVIYSFGAELSNYIHGADETADVTQNTGSSTVSFGGGSSIAQSFQPTASSISSVDVKLAVASPVNVTLTIQSDSGGAPSGTILTNSTVIKNITDLTATVQRFIFSSDVTVTPATTYWIVVSA